MEIPPPEVLKKSLVVPSKTLMGPGPSNAPPRVLQAMSYSVLGHMHQETFQIMDEIKEGIKYLFQTKNELSLAISASGHSGMEATMSNLIEPGDKVLICSNGLWGSRAADMAKRCGGIVTKIEKNLGDVFGLQEVENYILKLKPKLLFVVQGESSTGIWQPIEGFGEICQKYNCLLAVDVVASVGGVPFLMDEWKVDVAYAGAQKVLGVPPGLTLISFSSRAQKAIFERKTAGNVYYWDMTILGQQWNCFKNVRPYHHTTCSNLLCALREALAMLAEEGLENVIKRHEECYERLKKGFENLGLTFFVKDERNRLRTVTSLVLEGGIDKKDVIDYAMKKYNFEIAAGLGPTAIGNILRIGLMGYNAKPETVDFALEVLKESLDHAKKKTIAKL
ncbi:alanine--glyoxylate aminotransferase [Leptinotarsa decemlineata]|uniref:alanine--glyoxylate aminotransferase n=1 Tax=Leptinotarsa decemlineata TaxID=7539 RepID=UPI003D30B439